MEDANGQPVSLSSGFFVLDGVIASNHHVIEGASRGYAKIIGQKAKFDIEGTMGTDPERDLVLLKCHWITRDGLGLIKSRITTPPKTTVEVEFPGGTIIEFPDTMSMEEIKAVLKREALRTQPLSLGDSDAAEVGEPVYAVGNPQGLEGTFSQGILSSIRKVGSDKILQITAPISPGSSGGPVLNSKGEVIGVSVATFRGGQNLNFAIPSNYLKALLQKLEPAKPLTGAKYSERRQSIFADLGGQSTEGVVGTNLTYDSYSQMGNYSFSLVNKLREPVRNVYCLVVFYDVKGAPLDVAVVHYPGVIPGGLAKRVTGRVDPSVERLNSEHRTLPPHPPRGKIEFRVLDFQLVE